MALATPWHPIRHKPTSDFTRRPAHTPELARVHGGGADEQRGDEDDKGAVGVLDVLGNGGSQAWWPQSIWNGFAFNYHYRLVSHTALLTVGDLAYVVVCFKRDLQYRVHGTCWRIVIGMGSLL